MTWGDEGGARPGDENSFELLAPLVAAATVRIHPPPAGYAEGEPVPPPWGSGFFVAPEWVLTCAHVALSGGGAEGGRREVGLTFRGVDRPVPGRVEWARPEAPPPGGAMWPAPDLALVRLLGPPPPPPEGPGCVWLSERTARLFTREEVAFFGSTEMAGVFDDVSGRCTIRGEIGSDGLLRLGSEDEVPHGVSGGPLVDLARGEVIGVIKARRDMRDGGLATSVIQLRRLPGATDPVRALADDVYQAVMHGHDRYHAERHRAARSGELTWTDAQNALGASGPGGLTPGQRVKLLGMLAELPPPVSTRRLVDLFSDLRGRPHEGALPAPRAWREGLGLLHELRPGTTGLEAVLRYALRAATEERPYPALEGAEERLRKWVRSVAEDSPTLPRRVRNLLGREEEARRQHRAVARESELPFDLELDLLDVPPGVPDAHALLEIFPSAWEGGRYDWRISSTIGGRCSTIDEDFRAEGLEKPPERLRAALAEAFRRADEPGSPVPLHVAVPYSLFEIPFERWWLAPDGPTLGERRPVVMRCTDPVPGAEDSPELRALRQARWAMVHLGRLVVDPLDCRDGEARAVPETAALVGRDTAAVPVLCRTPNSGGTPVALPRVMASGYNVILWRRELEPREPSCDGFHHGVVGAARGAGHAGRLPIVLWRLREAAARGVAHASWSSDVALLYADPEVKTFDDDYLEAP
ncbi:VMAP-C domain-containing protein [Streptomyces triticirhizae]|uniref:Serine protease n=1 Tax=Streptomyces triticirhizae TaxID=2483353 RepID=A0A3M2LNX9_9ACTN|nr:trypsin-like peptidase domain-containing protein [Streptomyces triticirhizae]RMI36518.1 serine protease [Streptomyces triticirhizae]